MPFHLAEPWILWCHTEEDMKQGMPTPGKLSLRQCFFPPPDSSFLDAAYFFDG